MKMESGSWLHKLMRTCLSLKPDYLLGSLSCCRSICCEIMPIPGDYFLDSNCCENMRTVEVRNKHKRAFEEHVFSRLINEPQSLDGDHLCYSMPCGAG
ncbi:hypothetical protein QQP08_003617 [Theobroma cacao]|nr:hypothetical protein QQP08_003617 [Theobroma cacao]